MAGRRKSDSSGTEPDKDTSSLVERLLVAAWKKVRGWPRPARWATVMVVGLLTLGLVIWRIAPEATKEGLASRLLGGGDDTVVDREGRGLVATVDGRGAASGRILGAADAVARTLSGIAWPASFGATAVDHRRELEGFLSLLEGALSLATAVDVDAGRFSPRMAAYWRSMLALLSVQAEQVRVTLKGDSTQSPALAQMLPVISRNVDQLLLSLHKHVRSEIAAGELDSLAVGRWFLLPWDTFSSRHAQGVQLLRALTDAQMSGAPTARIDQLREAYESHMSLAPGISGK